MKKVAYIFFLLLFITGCNKPPNEELNHLKKADKFIENVKYDEAVIEYKAAIKVNSSSIRAYFMLGEIYFHQSDLNRFRTQVLNFVVKYKRNPALPKLKQINFNTVNKIILTEGIKNYKKTLEVNADIEKKDIDDLHIHYQLGWAYLVLNKYKDSRSHFNRSVTGTKDAWGTDEAIIFLNYLEKKGLTKNNVYYRGNPLVKKISLTFDDGPNNTYTPKVLEILNRYNIKATFFMLGENIKRFPDIARKAAASGHTIGNHTYRHPNLYITNLSETEIREEIDSTALIIEEITGKKPNLFRSPYNYLDEELISILKEKKYNIISWTYAPRDWEDISSNKILQRVLENVTTGAIFLLHDGGGNRSETVKALPIIIEGLQKQGFEFVDLPELLNLETQ